MVTPVLHGRLALPHPRFRGGMPSSPSPYKGEETDAPSFRGLPLVGSPFFCQRITEHLQFPQEPAPDSDRGRESSIFKNVVVAAASHAAWRGHFQRSAIRTRGYNYEDSGSPMKDVGDDRRRSLI